MPDHYFRFGPGGFGFGFWPPEWWEFSLLDVDRTADEIILTLRVPRDVKKEDVKVEFREGLIRIRFPRRRGGAWETIPVE